MSPTYKRPGAERTIPKYMRVILWVTGITVVASIIFVLAFPPMLRWYVGDKYAQLTFPNQDKLTPAEFERLAMQIEQEQISGMVENAVAGEQNAIYRAEKERLFKGLPSLKKQAQFSHIDRFRKAGITSYEGPQTCLQCHETMSIRHVDGSVTEEKTIDNVMNTSHYQLFSAKSGFSTVGYDGRKVNEGRPIPVGKIDRACGIPGSFTWTGWAALINSKPADANGEVVVRSEGCGQCHIGGSYGPPSDEMMPITFRQKHTKRAIDCLICHSQSYDMNQRYAFDDGVGIRWNQDRSMKAALTVGKPTQEGCLHCHQHNMGGDSYPFNDASKHPGYKNARLLHNSAKRGTPYAPQADVHAKAGMTCLDCHISVGHKIARGTKGVDLVSNDLPGVEVSCEKCHTDAPHTANIETRAFLNGHTATVSCEACHITKLWEDNIVMTDWTSPEWDEHEGMYHPKAVVKTGNMKEAVEYLWFNGNGTFLANALGSNPRGGEPYSPLMDHLVKYDKVANITLNGAPNGEFLTPLSPEMYQRRQDMVNKNIIPAQEMGKSKIYPFKLFNARMYEDMNNQGPFGAMIMPFDYKTYYETGNAYAAMEKAVAHPIVKRMYQLPFKLYMMDEFMAYFGVGSWTTKYPLDKENRQALQGNWMRQMGTLMINHGITREGHSCATCHAPENGLIDFRRLGYSEERVRDLQNLPELKRMGGEKLLKPVANGTEKKPAVVASR